MSGRNLPAGNDSHLAPARPFHHLLAPLDGSSLAETVLPSAFLIASRLQATVTLLHVLEHDAPDEIHGERHLRDREEAGEYLRAVAGRAPNDSFQVDWHVHPNPEHDIPGSIARHADELGADLVALATHGRGGMRGIFLGSIAQQVLRLGRQPVLLARPDGAPFAARRIAVALDGRPETEASIPIARMLAAGLEAGLYLVSVAPTVRTIQGERIAAATFSPSATSELLEIEARERFDYLSRLAAPLSVDSPVRFEVRRGDVAGELVAAVREAGADLVMMCTHARRGVEAFIAGSIAPRVAGQLRRPILLVRL